MQIDIYLDDIKTAVKRQLSVIGKHHSASKGDTLFSATTLSAVEEALMQQLIIDGAQLVVSALAPVLASYTLGQLSDDGSRSAAMPLPPVEPYLCFSVSTSRTNGALSAAALDSVKSLLIAYVTQAVLNMVLPELAASYGAVVQQQLAAATALVLTKTPPPKSAATLADFAGSVLI